MKTTNLKVTKRAEILKLQEQANYLMDGIYECIEKEPNNTLTEALCQCLVTTDMHSKAQTLILTEKICSEEELKAFLKMHIGERLLIRNQFDEVRIRPIGSC